MVFYNEKWVRVGFIERFGPEKVDVLSCTLGNITESWEECLGYFGCMEGGAGVWKVVVRMNASYKDVDLRVLVRERFSRFGLYIGLEVDISYPSEHLLKPWDASRNATRIGVKPGRDAMWIVR